MRMCRSCSRQASPAAEARVVRPTPTPTSTSGRRERVGNKGGTLGNKLRVVLGEKK